MAFMKSVRVMILFGEGINCENETAQAFQKAGAQTTLVHVQSWKKDPDQILQYQILALPGGFSFGDELHSGQILALDLKYSVAEALQKFLSHQGLVIGICNGFQVLMKLGIFEMVGNSRRMTLYHNRSAEFQDRWVHCKVPPSRCVWTQGLRELALPARHGEGRILLAGNEDEQNLYYQTLKENGQIAFVYDQDINGSYGQMAGLTDVSGQVLGLMPHPEAALEPWLYPDSIPATPEIALQIFKNGVQYASRQIMERT
jgi:phosphoribosylformylglycinamidine synthase